MLLTHLISATNLNHIEDFFLNMGSKIHYYICMYFRNYWNSDFFILKKPASITDILSNRNLQEQKILLPSSSIYYICPFQHLAIKVIYVSWKLKAIA